MAGRCRIRDEATADSAAVCAADSVDAVAEILKRTTTFCHHVSLSTSLDRTAVGDEHGLGDSSTPRVGDLRNQINPHQFGAFILGRTAW